MHKRANKLRDQIGGHQWTGDAAKSIEEKAYRKLHPQAD